MIFSLSGAIWCVGSSRLTEIEAARHYGSRFVTAAGSRPASRSRRSPHIPDGSRIVVTLVCDGLDPGITRRHMT
ncbi:arginase-like domain-containig protein (plasmid) [Rhizobium gallicum]|uniref:Arginase-like domain-containig protein n=1 Tax=Rhizobium gallicum TaxID=56730 RepID=A0A1L5NST9_9HYPH|nr:MULTISPECIES: hypothetical protein [Rhizobium]APO70967.1 arginase-like domain-containig protein [Rhizobium gallicum]QPB23695.1 hypothetical protein ISN39_29975 [Rhizobium sp. 007]